MTAPFRLVYSETCRKQIRDLPPQTKPVIKARIEEIAGNPSGGKCLQRELSGYLSLRINRYRVIYRIREGERVVEIHFVGRRRDVYELFGEHLGISVLGGD